MKKVLILVLSSDWPPYDKMIDTSRETWDLPEVEGTETIYYCSANDSGATMRNRDSKVMYFPVGNTLFDMGYRNIAMFEWILKNKEFDYVCRLNASHYCDKKLLAEFVQGLPESGLFMGVEADSANGKYCWGGCGYIISRDVIEKMIQEKDYWCHSVMEDQGISFLVERLGIPFAPGIKMCSIDQKGDEWQCTSYCEKGIIFSDFADLKDLGHFIYRCKQDGRRWQDAFIMHRLFETLNPRTGENKEPTNY